MDFHLLCDTTNKLDEVKKQLQNLHRCRQRMELPALKSEKEMKGHAFFLESAIEKSLAKMEELKFQLEDHIKLLTAFSYSHS